MNRSRFAAGFVAIFGFLLLTLIPVLSGYDKYDNKTYDMDKFHVPAIYTFAEQFPAVDVSDYSSATTPGMHLVLAAVVKIFGPCETNLQITTCIFGALLIFIAWLYASKGARPWVALAAVVPLALNPYILGNSIWVMTDNLSLALLAVVIGSSVFLRPRTGTAVWTSVAMVGAVLVRQINLWVVAGAWVATVLGSPLLRKRLPWRDELDDEFSPAHVIVISVGILMTIAVLVFFFFMWGGMVPPSLQNYHVSGGMNVAVTPYVLTMMAIYGSPIVLFFASRILGNSFTIRLMCAGAIGGFLLGIIFESTPGLEVGRVGGWMWSLAEKSPVVLGRTVFLVFGSVLGGILLGAIAGLLREANKGRAVFLLFLFGASFLAASTVNSQAFQRYFDGPTLLFLGWSLVLTIRATDRNDEQRVVFTCALMALIQIVFCSYALYMPLFSPN